MIHLKINDYYDMEYVGNITVGTPPQQFRVSPPVLLDKVYSRNIFDSKVSVEYYRNKAIVYGMIGNDTVGFGEPGPMQLSVPGMFIGQTYKIHDYFAEHPIDGVIGMAFSELSYNGFVSPLERAGDLGIVEPIFTVYMERVGGKAENVYGGTVTYGGLDNEHCSERVSYYPLSTTSYWKFKVDSFAMGGYSLKRRLDAISDTASSFIGTAYPFMADQIAEKVGAKVGQVL
ncbi:eukaryotic aspartyl protease [Oesophagostomum dentatum]|uniref:Eukaryotic aspartyl protease n=1 Tax=Oesophagostomum dentatum TaxID=61180 RepID=A0A0B1SK46_OESDE|nr:eukaryotic aspartyl protease [Oesophagostomum dentatum]